ncbi:YCF48-related protein [Thalassotalea psychrophila]|uniref:YCF48-related protein n=1 Tax=Thalassotalea psychrophila TaxID=3065647 RepID=A0ABY9TZF4_9GAMM|nr:YCF48-related protein [Colwelliaceae bacterium SQ149]
MYNTKIISTLMGMMLIPALASSALATEKPTNHQVDYHAAIQTPLASKSLLLAILKNQNSVIAAGEHGLVIDSSLAKHEWSQQSFPVNQTITAISKFSDEKLIAVGHEGLILAKTTDNDWQVVFNGYQLIAAKKLNIESNIVHLQKQIQEESNEDAIDELTMQLEELEFALEDLDAEIDSGPTSPLLDVVTFGDKKAFAVGAYNALLLTEDGASSWTLVNDRVVNPENFHFNSIKKSKDSIFIFGEAGGIYRSLDNGVSFEKLMVPYEGTFFGGEVFNNFIVAYGLKGNMVFSVDNGDSWQHLQIDNQSTLLGSTLDVDGSVWLVGHAGSIVKVSAEDASYKSVKHPSGDIFSDVIINKNILTLVGQNGVVVWQAEL